MTEDQTITMAAAAELIRQARADERERVHVTSTGLSGRTDYAQVRSEVLAVLRAKVESLFFVDLLSGTYVKRADVLVLLDGSSDE